MSDDNLEMIHINTIKKVAKTLLQSGEHYTIDPREIINLIEMLEDAIATQVPPDSGALRVLGARLADLLDEDQWNNAEPLLLMVKAELKSKDSDLDALRAENERLRAEIKILQEERKGSENR